MPKHYRPAGKKKEGNVAKYVTRSQAVKSLQVTLPVFRKLCILKGVFPREPRKKVKGNHHSYYHTKDILFLRHEPLLEKLRDIRSYDKKIKKAVSKKNRDLAERLMTRKPSYTLDRMIRERYPKFVDALRDLDDCISLVHLFAALPAVDSTANGEKIPVSRVHNCRRLSYEWQAYISRTHKLRKTFVSVKGIYYQAVVEGQTVTWLTPHALQQVLSEVDYRILLTFLEFYEALLGFVNFKLYHSINVKYPPILDPQLEALAADLYALTRYFDARSARLGSMTSGSDQMELQHLPSNELGSLVQITQGANEDEEDEETRECKNLFKNMIFFLSPEVPRESLLFVISAFGGIVSWDGEGAPFEESDQSISYQVVDRPTLGRKFLSREYIQPQWVFDCVNARIILPTEKYMVGCICPPHLSPFVDNEAEGHVPEYAEAIERLKAAQRKEVMPLPGSGKEDFDDPQSLVGIADRAEAIEVAKKRKEMATREKQYFDELRNEVKGYQIADTTVDNEPIHVDEECLDQDLRQREEDEASRGEALMGRKHRNILKAMKIGIQKKKDATQRLKKRQKQIKESEMLD